MSWLSPLHITPRPEVEIPQSLEDELFEPQYYSSTSNFSAGPDINYWREATINDLIRDEIVRQELDRAGEPYSNQLVDFILRDGKKLLAMAVLAHIEGKKLLEVMHFFQENGFRDSELSAEVRPPGRCLVKEQLIELDPNLWKIGMATRICDEWQWKVLVPVISTERDNYNFRKQATLPFTKLKTIGNGAFARVHQIRIQKGQFVDPTRHVSSRSLRRGNSQLPINIR